MIPPTTRSPAYPLGIWSMIVSHLLEVVLVILLGVLLKRDNMKRDRIQSAMEGGLEARDLDATAFLDLTDRENLKYALEIFFLSFSLTFPFYHFCV